jgi:branched-chain amino acid transport system permease protein
VAVIGLDLIVGYAGLVNLCHATFLGIGGYTAIILWKVSLDKDASWLVQTIGSDAILAWPVSLSIVALAALLIGYIMLRVRGVQFIMISLAFAQMFYVLGVLYPGGGGDEGQRIASRPPLAGFSIDNTVSIYYLALGTAAVAFLIAQVVVHSRFGAAIVGCRQNERRMMFLGYSTGSYLLAAFVIASIFAGASGILLAMHNKFIEPTALSWELSADLLVMLLVGGLGNLYGAFVGVLLYLLMEHVLMGYASDWRLFLGIPLLIVVLFAPGGVVGLWQGANGLQAGPSINDLWSRLWPKKPS